MSADVSTHSEGNTPISPDERDGLIPNLATRAELNEWERDNIIQAERWCFSVRIFNKWSPTLEQDIRGLHSQMFGATWKWAGTYRKTEKTIGIPVVPINTAMAAFLGDVAYWIENKTFEPDELAVRYHHRLVAIHPFPNGNGRLSRLCADLLVMQLGRPRFTWGRANLQKAGDVRAQYIAAIKATDAGDVQPLLAFARS